MECYLSLMEFHAKNLPFGRTIRNVGRLAQITNVLARNGLWSFIEVSGLQKWLTPEQAKEAEEISKSDEVSGLAPIDQVPVTSPQGLPHRLRKSLEELGPAFVKLGQMLASREDLLPAPFVEELRKLHQNVVALPYEVIRKTLKDELGARLEEFESISERPLAAGSIGQVHEARLRSGQRVVIKIQRPNIQSQIEGDLALMEILAGLVERYVPEAKSVRPTAVFKEFSRAMIGELDFVREGGNTLKVGANFAANDFVIVPEIFWGLTTSRVLTQTFLEGISAWERDKIVASGIDPEALVERGFEAFLQMVFVDGLFHGDLHPGNLLAIEGSRIGIIDFGLCVRIGRNSREHLAGLLVSLIKEDYSSMVMHVGELSEQGPEFDIAAFEHDITNAIAPFVGLKLADIRTGRIFWDLAKIAARHGAPLPRELVLVFKTLVTFEGIGSHLSPGFDVVKTCEKFTRTIVSQMYSPDQLKQQSFVVARDVIGLLRHAPFQLKRVLRQAAEGELTFNVRGEELSRVSTALDRSFARLSVSVIIAGLIVGSSILVFAHGGMGQDYGHIPAIGVGGFALALLLGMYVVLSILRGGRL